MSVARLTSDQANVAVARRSRVGVHLTPLAGWSFLKEVSRVAVRSTN